MLSLEEMQDSAGGYVSADVSVLNDEFSVFDVDASGGISFQARLTGNDHGGQGESLVPPHTR